ncbi:MAG: TIGR00730 family Rossman fold protein [Abditibacteriales bacterium]|nr:TIGR00730 family Rossman fold protein [Abditibacteriales bacterium]
MKRSLTVSEEKQYVVDYMHAEDAWRMWRIVAEFVEGFEQLAPHTPAVTIYGSARTKPSDPDYIKAVETARLFAQNGIAVITGGGPGIMEAANKGAAEAGGVSIGLNIELPFEQKPNPYANVQIEFRYFFVRKVMFLKYAQALICFPGGFGTLDEFYESLTLIQTKKILPYPLILVGSSYWRGLLDWMEEQLLKPGRISPDDLHLVQVIDEPAAIVQHVLDWLKKDSDQ